jgi:PAS domain S-box-containing protein
MALAHDDVGCGQGGKAVTGMDVARIVTEGIIAAAADAVVATDHQGIICLWNPGAERIFGHRADEALGQSLDLIIPERLRARHWQGFHEVVSAGKSRYGEGDLLSVPGLRKDGQKISLEFTIVPFRGDQGRIIGMAAVMRDVTARFEEIKQLRQQLAAATGRTG